MKIQIHRLPECSTEPILLKISIKTPTRLSTKSPEKSQSWCLPESVSMFNLTIATRAFARIRTPPRFQNWTTRAFAWITNSCFWKRASNLTSSPRCQTLRMWWFWTKKCWRELLTTSANPETWPCKWALLKERKIFTTWAESRTLVKTQSNWDAQTPNICKKALILSPWTLKALITKF